MTEISYSAAGHDLAALNDWYQQPLGQGLKTRITAELTRMLRPLPVRELLYFGVAGFEEALQGRQSERMVFFTDIACQQLLANHEHTLPLQPDSQDCVVSLHGLDVAIDSQGVLREIDRIISAGGYVAIVGFNKYSNWGLYKPLRNLYGWKPTIPWQLHFHSISRLRDWLSLLDFEICEVCTLGYQPVLQKSGILSKLPVFESLADITLPFWGNVYILVARKRTIPLTPLRFDWKFRSGLMPGVMKPSA